MDENYSAVESFDESIRSFALTLTNDFHFKHYAIYQMLRHNKSHVY
jgi:hypothetical protein